MLVALLLLLEGLHIIVCDVAVPCTDSFTLPASTQPMAHVSLFAGMGHMKTKKRWPLSQQCSETSGGGRKGRAMRCSTSPHQSLTVCEGKGVGCPSMQGSLQGMQTELANWGMHLGLTGRKELGINYGRCRIATCQGGSSMVDNPVPDVG